MQRTWTALTLGVVMAAMCACGGTAPGAGAPAAGAAPVSVPEFTLEDQTGLPFGLHDLHGKVWVAGAVVTHDTATTPAVVEAMAALARDVVNNTSLTDVEFVSVAADPDTDRTNVLREYARAHAADQARWHFLSGTRASVRPVLEALTVMAPGAAQGGALAPIARIAVVSRDGRVKTVIDAAAKDAVSKVRAAVGEAVLAPPPVDVYVPPNVRTPDWLEGQRAAESAALAGSKVSHDFQFTDRIGSSGITFRHVATEDLGKYYRAVHYDHGTAVAAADVDGDGRPDLYFVNQLGSNALYRNLGDNRFEDITAAAGVGVGDRACVGASFADVDNDGDADLFVTAVREGNLLFLNDGHGKFTDVTKEAGVAGRGGHSSGAVFFDFDNDGRLDLFVTNVGKYTRDERYPNGLWKSFGDAFAGHLHPDRSETSILYHNLGGGKFQDVTRAADLVHTAWSGEATPLDYDGDGLLDLYVAAMQGHDEVWHNLGNGRFARTSRAVFPATPWGTMGVKVFDWNGDGRLDVLATDMHTDMSSDLRPQDERKKHDPATMFPLRFEATDGNHVLGNALFTSRGAGKFQETSDAAGVETGWPWGPSVGDLNADGWPDLFITAGMNYPLRYKGNDILLNNGGRRFVPAELALGAEPRRRIVRPWFELDCDAADRMQDICQGEIAPLMTSNTKTPEERGKVAARHGHVTVWAARASRSAVVLDLDGDGDLDIVTNDYGDVPQILVSDLAQRGKIHTLSVTLVGGASNRDGLGAVVTVRAGGRTQVAVNDGKAGYLGQSRLPLFFGLGSAADAVVTVRWPSRATQTVQATGSTLAVSESR
jgi:cytochrome oxidase Cu insertion factor (SCO1/SenC/PrrC family)